VPGGWETSLRTRTYFILHPYLEVVAMPFTPIFFFFSGFAVGVVFGTLFMIMTRA
jgi:hypothetical protein